MSKRPEYTGFVDSAGSRRLMTRRRSGAHGNGFWSASDSANEARRARSVESFTTTEGSMVTEDALEMKKNALLTQKQAELDGVFKRHDDLVRESFHMDHFRTMLAYDPEEAGKDNSQVLQNYKANFDLINTAVPTAGPSRQTRRALTERRKIIIGTSSPTVLISPQFSPKSIKRKSKPKTAEILGILASARDQGHKKGKEKEIAPEAELVQIEQTEEPQNTEKAKQTILPEPESASVAIRRKNGLKRQHTIDTVQAVPTEKKRQKLERKIEASKNDKAFCPVQENERFPLGNAGRRSVTVEPPLILASPLKTPHSHAPLFAKPSPPSLLPPRSSTPQQVTLAPQLPETPKHHIKRIKLIVRRPPPTLTNPRQCVPPPKYGHSLKELLASYTTHNDQEVGQETIQRLAAEAAVIREREQLFKQQGRFIPGTDVLFGTTPNNSSYTTPKRETKDTWDAVVEAIVAQGKSKTKKAFGRHVTGQVASKVQAYWDAIEAKKDKVRAQEERKLRMLAKSTIKLVVTEWKRAVFHIREQERLKAEAEERKRGHAHLDAILDQSGQLLETQQTELKRADRHSSRSSSVFDPIFNWGSDQDEDDDEEEEQEQEDDAETNQDEDNGNDETATIGADQSEAEEGSFDLGEDEEDTGIDADSSMLLIGHPRRQGSSEPSASPLYSPKLDQTNVEIPIVPPSAPLPIDNTGNDGEDSIVSFNDLANPGRESSRLRLTRGSPLKCNLTDYSLSDSEHGFSPSASPIDLDGAEKGTSMSRPPIPSGPDTFYVVDLNADDQPDVEKHSPILISPINLLTEPEIGTNEDQTMGLNEETCPSDPADIHNDAGPIIKPSTNMEESESRDSREPDGVGQELFGTPEADDEKESPESQIPEYLKPYAVAPLDWDPSEKITPPVLLRGVLRPYQQSGMEWLATLHTNNLNGILADEMGLGKTIQTIALLAHLACDRGIWGPHLIIVPTSVLLNWEMEFKKFLPGFKILSYHGSSKRRKELRQGWMDKHHFNVCITSYTLASKDQHIFKRKPWYYMILDEAHMIKNFRSQRWNILLMFRSFRRLLLTGTPLQNNLTELWALLQFLMSGSTFVNLKEFGDWFSNPLEKAIEMGNTYDEETMQRVSKLHTVLRPYLLRRLKRDVEKELPSKFEHLLLCPLSKRQRYLYDEFMSRAQTRDALQSGVYQKIANILMQLRKVCNHPDLFEVRPIVTSFAMQRSAIAAFEIQELLIRKRWLEDEEETVNLDVLGFRFTHRQNISYHAVAEIQRLDATNYLPYSDASVGELPPKDTRTLAGFRRYSEYLQRAKVIARWSHIGYLNRLRCSQSPLYSQECILIVQTLHHPIIPLSVVDTRFHHLSTVYRINAAVKSYVDREQEMAGFIDRFAFVTPAAVALDMPHIAFAAHEKQLICQPTELDAVLHRATTKLQIAFPDPSLLQYDCGKLQKLAELLREKKAGGHRILIFTQMTRILDILEIFLNFHGYLYLRLDGATKIEDRQYITERFNADSRVFCFISSSRSGGVGINLTGADTVVFYDSDFNPQMDRQCEDRAHRIGQIRDVHIYRFVSQHTVEEAMLRKANQKRSLDDLVIQKGEFDWRSLFNDENALTKALGDYEDVEDAHAAAVAAKEEFAMEGADEADFGGDTGDNGVGSGAPGAVDAAKRADIVENEDFAVPNTEMGANGDKTEAEEEDEGGTTVDYMLAFVERDYDFFREWRL